MYPLKFLTRPLMPRLCTVTATVLLLFVTAAHAQNTINVGPGTTYPTIQSGINAAANGDTVLVAAGTYFENIDFTGKAITVTSSSGAVIDGGSKGPAVTFKSSEPRTAVLSNITITHGGALPGSGTGNAGIYVYNSSPTISGNTITSNNCWGIDVEAAAPLVQGNTITATQDPNGQCSSFGGGAAIYINGNINGGTPPSILGNTITGNVESGLEKNLAYGGAGVAVWGGSPIIQGNTISNNVTLGTGGAINVVSGSGTTILQNLIYGNQAACGAGAVAFDEGQVGPAFDLLVANNTMVNNTDKGYAGSTGCANDSQIYPFPLASGNSGPTVVFVNNIVSGSTTYPAVNCSTDDSPSEAFQPVFDHNLLYNAGNAFFGSFCVDVSAKYGNISVDPLFVNPAGNNYQLQSTSPAIDAGNNSALPIITQLTGTQLTQDFAGNPRVLATSASYPIIDMGAYEYAGGASPSPTTIVLTPSSYTGNAGTNYTLTANLASALGTPTGSANFFLDGQIGTSVISGSGVATLTNFLMTPGVHSLYAQYPGQGSFTSAVSVVTVVDITLYTPSLTLTSSVNPSNVGQLISLTVTASSPDGYIPTPITLKDTSTNMILATLTPNSSGVVAVSTNTLTIGSHNITATYAGDGTHTSASASLTQVVGSIYATTTTIQSSSNPSIYQLPVTFTTQVSANNTANGVPTGSVTFTDGSTLLQTVPLTASGAAVFTTSTLAIGVHTITATYVPVGAFAASSAALTQTVNAFPTTTTIVSSLNPSSYGQAVTFTSGVSANNTANGIPTGSVTFTDGNTLLQTVPLTASGGASFTTTSALPVGANQTITATYVPTGFFAASSASLLQTVNSLLTTAVLTVSPPTTAASGTPVVLTATISPVVAPTGTIPVPTGTVTFYNGGTALGSPVALANGAASLTTSSLPIATDQLTCKYSGDSIYVGSPCNVVPIIITVIPTALTVTPSANPSPALTAVTFTAHLTVNGQPAPAGDAIALTVGAGNINLTTNASGNAVYTTSALTPGTYGVSASFAATTTMAGSSATPFTETIIANSTATTLVAVPQPGYQNQSVTLMATVAAATGTAPPAGSVALYNTTQGSTLLGSTPVTASASGATAAASFPFSTSVPGTYTFMAVYTPGNSSFTGSQSTTIQVVILPQDFTLSTSVPSITIETEHHASVTLTVASIGQFAGPIQISCGTLPQFVTCELANSTVQLPANGTVTTTLTLDTDAILGFASSAPPVSPWTLGRGVLAAVLPLAMFGFRRRHKLRSLLSVAVLAVLGLGLMACSGHYPDHAAPGTYTIPLTASGIAVGSTSTTPTTHTANLTLVVTP